MDGLIAAATEINRLDGEINSKISMLQMFKNLHALYPDLMLYQLDYDYVACSSTVNSLVDLYDACERDDVGGITYIDVWPYFVVEGYRVYSNPPYFTVGANNTEGFGIKTADGWVDTMESDNISNVVIRKIRNFLKSKPAIDY